MIPNGQPPRRLTFLRVFCAVQLVSALYVWYQFQQNGYLPSPFAYDKSDTFMDLFHPMYWSDNAGVYTQWGSVYPPINFLLLQPLKYLITSGRQYSDAFELRSEAGRYPIWLFAIYLLIPVLILRSKLWSHFSRLELIPIYLAMAFASPMLFTLERGNLILLGLPVLALAAASSGTLLCIAIAILINIKPYFAVLILTFLLTRRFESAFIITLAAGAIFLVSGILLDTSFVVFLSNLVSFSENQALFSAREVLSLPSSISGYAHVLRVYEMQGGTSIYGIDPTWLATGIEAFKWLVLASTLVALSLSRAVPLQILIVISVAFIENLGIWIGGYSIIFYLPLIPIFMRMRYGRAYLVMLIAMFAPLDLISLLSENIGSHDVYISGRFVEINWNLSLGVLVRPPLNLALLALLTWEVFVKYSVMGRSVTGLRQVPGETLEPSIVGHRPF